MKLVLQNLLRLLDEIGLKTISYPFRLYKGFTTSGGIGSPLIIKGIESKSKISNEFMTLLDIAPTIYDISNSEYFIIKIIL